MFDFYPTCLEKTKHVGIFTPGCFFPHMFGFWHICMGKGTHVWKKPHNYMIANVWHFPHMCGKSHRPAYFPLSYQCSACSVQKSSTSGHICYWLLKRGDNYTFTQLRLELCNNLRCPGVIYLCVLIIEIIRTAKTSASDIV